MCQVLKSTCCKRLSCSAFQATVPNQCLSVLLSVPDPSGNSICVAFIHSPVQTVDQIKLPGIIVHLKTDLMILQGCPYRITTISGILIIVQILRKCNFFFYKGTIMLLMKHQAIPCNIILFYCKYLVFCRIFTFWNKGQKRRHMKDHFFCYFLGKLIPEGNGILPLKHKQLLFYRYVSHLVIPGRKQFHLKGFQITKALLILCPVYIFLGEKPGIFPLDLQIFLYIGDQTCPLIRRLLCCHKQCMVIPCCISDHSQGRITTQSISQKKTSFLASSEILPVKPAQTYFHSLPHQISL